MSESKKCCDCCHGHCDCQCHKPAAKPKPKPAPKKPAASKKALPVLTKAEMGRVIDLGLGRGVDATDVKPWANKSSFQVRPVYFENVVGTEEGGALQSYEREISSVYAQQANLKSSIAVPQSPVNVSMDAELSRSVSNSRRAVGKKVTNRTISFKAELEDIPLSEGARRGSVYVRDANEEVDVASEAEEAEEGEQVGDLYTYTTFEERLSKWILEQVLHDGKDHDVAVAENVKEALKRPLESLNHFLKDADHQKKKRVKQLCRDFVYHFRITHYVNSIVLGAAEYRVFSETEYIDKLGTAGTFGLEKLASVALSQKSSFSRSKKSSDIKKIGTLSEQGTVERGSYNEAVVGVNMLPISNLIKNSHLRDAMQKVLLKYVEQEADTSSGPFIISANDRLFWKVNADEGYTVEATTDITDASLFFIVPNDNGDHPYEFYVTYISDQQHIYSPYSGRDSAVDINLVAPIARYLDAGVNAFGFNHGPLRLKHSVKHRHCRLVLHGRISEEGTPVSISAWSSGNDAFYINCVRRRLKRDGYICIKRHRHDRFITACLPNTSVHDEHNFFMLFRLLPASYIEKRPHFWSRKESASHSPVPEVLKLSTPESKRKKQPSVEEHGGPGKHLDTTGGSIPPAGEGIAMKELAVHDPTVVKPKDTSL